MHPFRKKKILCVYTRLLFLRRSGKSQGVPNKLLPGILAFCHLKFSPRNFYPSPISLKWVRYVTVFIHGDAQMIRQQARGLLRANNWILWTDQERACDVITSGDGVIGALGEFSSVDRSSLRNIVFIRDLFSFSYRQNSKAFTDKHLLFRIISSQ